MIDMALRCILNLLGKLLMRPTYVTQGAQERYISITQLQFWCCEQLCAGLLSKPLRVYLVLSVTPKSEAQRS